MEAEIPSLLALDRGPALTRWRESRTTPIGPWRSYRCAVADNDARTASKFCDWPVAMARTGAGLRRPARSAIVTPTQNETP